jgi:hypothetical protein
MSPYEVSSSALLVDLGFIGLWGREIVQTSLCSSIYTYEHTVKENVDFRVA